MRTPPICCEAHEEGGHVVERTMAKQHMHGGGTQRFQETSTKLARFRRFFSQSLSGRRDLTLNGRSHCKSPMLETKLNESIETNEKAHFMSLWEGSKGANGRAADVVQHHEEREDQNGSGVPIMVRALCDHMLNYGIDYETLLSDDWCPERMRSSILSISYDFEEDDPAKTCSQLRENSGLIDTGVTAGLFRLFLEDLPQPIVDEDVVKDLTSIFKDLQIRRYANERARRVLERRLSQKNFELLKYLMQFFNRVSTLYERNCSDSPPVFGNLLARVVSEEEEYMDHTFSTASGSARTIAEVLVANSTQIFNFGSREDDVEYSSEASSSPCNSLPGDFVTGDNASKFDEDDSTTTTTDTDEFLSPPVSPTKTAFQTGGGERSRSTAEALESADNYRSKKSTYSKSYLPSIIDLLSSPDESWKDEVQRSSRSDFEDRYSSSNQCTNSDGSSDGDRDVAPSSSPLSPCPHEERRLSERFFHRGASGSNSEQGTKTSKKTKKIKKRKHSKERSYRIPSSGEEDEVKETFNCLLSGQEDEAPQTFDPSPACDPINMTYQSAFSEPEVEEEESNGKGWVTDLMSSSEPVTSDKPWGIGDQASQDSYRRTARHYSREDEEEQSSPQFYSPHSNTDDISDIVRNPQAAVKLLTKNVNSIKRKIKRFEEEFESMFGYRPSHSEKMKHKDVKKHLTELHRARKELKQIKEDVAGMINSQTIVNFPMSLLRCQESTTPSPEVLHTPGGAKETLMQVLDHLEEKRKDAMRPESLVDMSSDQISEEKTALQRALLYYESLHGRPSTREDRDFARPLYDRYRQVKRTMVRTNSRMKESLIELEPIIEHVEMEFTLTSPRHRGSLRDEDFEQQSPSSSIINEDANPEFIPGNAFFSDDSISSHASSSAGVSSPKSEGDVYNLHSLPTEELKERKREAKEEKKRLRRVLREYEEEFEAQNGRKVLKEDRGFMDATYAEYKHAKAKLRLLEALLSKEDRVRV